MAQHVFTGSGAPATTPTAVGQHYIDTTNKVSYISVGTSSPADWETSDAADVASDLTTHMADIANPHSVTKSQVGLANVDNTSDINKPISTATQAALDTKLTNSNNLSDVTNPTSARSNLGLGDVAIENILPITKGGTGQSNATAALNNLLPDQTGNAGKTLQTDGSNTSWQDAVAPITGSNSKMVFKDSSGVVKSLESYNITDNDELNISAAFNIDTSGNKNAEIRTFNANATEDSPNNNFQANYTQINIDTDNTGFELGTSGTGIYVNDINVVHQGTSDIGGINLRSANFNIGNGTDPIDVNGIGYSFGFGQINANVNLSGPLQGYGFQPNINALASISPSTYLTGFYDNANIACATPGYTSANFSPIIESINNNNNYNGLSIFPTIDTFTGNAGFIGVSIGGNLGTFNTNGYFQGVNINPNITSARYAAGLNVIMNNVTPYAGVQSSLTEQDLTFTFTQPGDNNNYSMEYTSGATAGSEVVTILGNTVTVQIEDGVSTATQIKAALDGNAGFNAAVDTTISGTAGNAQTVFGPTNFAGGVNPGNVKAAYLNGDVEITGALTFGGALSVGKLNAFGSQTLSDGGGNPQSIHMLITQPTIGDNLTVANADILGVNTAMLLTIGDNTDITSAFIGLSALGLPAVISMGSGATLDRASGATFALSLDASAGGGVIDTLDLCRSLAIPNGSTTVNKLVGYKMDLPFGDPGNTSWGFYESPGINNYFAGNLLIGGTPGSDDTVTNDSVALEIKSTTKALVLPRMTTTEKNALTAIEGMYVYDTTLAAPSYYNGTVWV